MPLPSYRERNAAALCSLAGQLLRAQIRGDRRDALDVAGVALRTARRQVRVGDHVQERLHAGLVVALRGRGARAVAARADFGGLLDVVRSAGFVHAFGVTAISDRGLHALGERVTGIRGAVVPGLAGLGDAVGVSLLRAVGAGDERVGGGLS